MLKGRLASSKMNSILDQLMEGWFCFPERESLWRLRGQPEAGWALPVAGAWFEAISAISLCSGWVLR